MPSSFGKSCSSNDGSASACGSAISIHPHNAFLPAVPHIQVGILGIGNVEIPAVEHGLVARRLLAGEGKKLHSLAREVVDKEVFQLFAVQRDGPSDALALALYLAAEGNWYST